MLLLLLMGQMLPQALVIICKQVAIKRLTLECYFNYKIYLSGAAICLICKIDTDMVQWLCNLWSMLERHPAVDTWLAFELL